MSLNDKDKVILTCKDCGKSFELTYGRYRRFPKDHDWRCKSCQLIYRSKWFERLSPEEQKLMSEKKSKAAKKVWNNLTPKEYKKRSQSQKDRWSRLSPEEKEIIMANTRKGNIEYMNRPDVKAKLVARNIERWNNMTEKEKQEELTRLNNIRDNYWNSLTDEEKFLKMKKMRDGLTCTGPTELDFHSLLNIKGLIENINYKWGYSTYPFIHDEYYNKFGRFNPITGEINFPYHIWDFIIYSKNGNNMLIDLDGSAHDKNNMNFKRDNNSYTEREKIDYNDLQRPYQIPIGNEGYVIMCYNDKLEDETPVLSFTTNNIMTYKDLLSLIDFSQLTKKEINKLLNSK